MATSYFVFGIALNGTFVALPMMLRLEPSFGATSASAVAALIGVTQVPYGVSLLVMQTAGYLRLSAAGVSDAACLASAGALTALSTALFAIASLRWHLFALYMLQGAGIGLTFGAYINVPNAYIARFYPHAIAQARSVPFPFFNLGQLLGPILLPLLGPSAHRTGWACAGLLHALATVLVLVVVRRVQAALAKVSAEASGDTTPRRIADKLWQMGLLRIRGPLALFELAAKAEQSGDSTPRGRNLPALDTAL